MAAPACLTARPVPSLWGHRGCHENPWEKRSEGGSHLARDTGYRRKTHEWRLLPSPVCHTPEPNRPPSKSVAASFFFFNGAKKKKDKDTSPGEGQTRFGRLPGPVLSSRGSCQPCPKAGGAWATATWTVVKTRVFSANLIKGSFVLRIYMSVV